MSDLFKLLGILGVVYLLFFRGATGGKLEMSQTVKSVATPARQVPAADRIRVILFTGTEWCPACVHLESTVVSTTAWQEFARSEITFRKIDVPADRSRLTGSDRAAIAKYGVRGYPTMVVTDASGKELSRQVGSGAPVENYKDWIRRHSRYYR
jgi:thiol-disulfide isomerase/thioredoxin